MGAQAEAPRAPEPFREELEVRLVTLPVLARDRQGRPVTDLRPEEVEVRHRGRPMRLAYLRPFVPPSSGEALPDVRLGLDLAGGAAPVSAASSPDPRHLLLLVDLENDPREGRARAAEQAARFVERGLAEGDRVAVLSWNGELHVEQAFTADRRAAALALRRAFGHPPRPAVDLRLRVEGLLDRMEDCRVGSEAGPFDRVRRSRCAKTAARDYAAEVRPRSESFLDALEAVIRLAGGLDGRASVVAISHGSALDLSPEIAEAARAVFGDGELASGIALALLGDADVRSQAASLMQYAVRHGVTLHFVDRSVMPAGAIGARRGAAYRAPGAQPVETAFRAAQGDLEELAAFTGGTFVAGVDVGAGLEQVVELERGGYELGYYLDRHLEPGELERVMVDSKRRGVTLVHRRGVVAPSELARRDTAVASTLTVGGPRRLPGEAERVRLPLRLEIDPRTAGYEVRGDAALADLTLHLWVETRDGRRAADLFHFVNHAYPRALWESGEIEPAILGGWVELPPGDFRIVARVRNPRADRVGEAEHRLRVATRRAESGPAGDP